MVKRIAYYSSVGMVAALAACGGGGGGGSSSGAGDVDGSDVGATGVESRDLTYTSRPDDTDKDPSVSFFVEDRGKLGVRVNGLDADGDGTVSKPEVKNVSLEEGDTLSGAALALSCESKATGDSGSGDTFDVGVNLDTTASMGAAAGILADRTAAFATELEDRGLDVRFAGMTVGDAFATKNPESSEFTDPISTGSLGEPPGFDPSERPGTGTDLRSAAEMETFFREVSEVVATGSGGFDPTENYLGSLEYLNDNVAWREGAGRILISIGDQCAHTPATAGTITADWAPSEPSTVEETFADSGTAVNVVGPDTSGETFFACSSDAYDMKDLAAATGGGSTNIGSCGSEDTCEVNLTELPILDAVTTERATESCDLGDASGTRTVRLDIEVDSRTWKAAAVLELLE